MVSTLILTHGGLARELLSAAEIIVGGLEGFTALSLEWTDSFDEAQAKTLQTLEELPAQDGVLILTDIHGGTPFNVAASFRQAGEVEVVAGVNLPMVVRLACKGARDMNVSMLADWIQEKARGSIRKAGSNGQPTNACSETKHSHRKESAE